MGDGKDHLTTVNDQIKAKETSVEAGRITKFELVQILNINLIEWYAACITNLSRNVFFSVRRGITDEESGQWRAVSQ